MEWSYHLGSRLLVAREGFNCPDHLHKLGNQPGCRGVTRADFRYDDSRSGTKGLVCLEVNTQPGMTETSLVPEMAQYAGINFDDLVRWMVEDASLNR